MAEALALALVPEPAAPVVPRGPLALPPPNAVDVWIMRLDPCRAGCSHASTVDPQQVAARRATRALLARYLDIAPAALCFESGPYGKPELRGSPLSFSVARRQGLALLAVAAEGRIGVDLELGRPLPELDGICTLLHPAERALLAQAPASRREELFYRLWTRKEAALKAVGTGLAHGLDRISVIGDQVLVPFTDASTGDPARLSLHDIALGRGWFAALAGEAGCRGPRLFTLPDAGALQGARR